MQLLAGSLNVTAEGFLHAGYLSAYPRTFPLMGFRHLDSATANVLEVKASLELQEQSPASPTESAVPVQPPKPPVSPPAMLVSDAVLLAVVFGFFACVASLYYRRVRHRPSPGWRLRLLSATVGLLLALATYGFVSRQRMPVPDGPAPPWQDVPVRQYKDPMAATQVILHGLIANALTGCPPGIESLAAIEEEVAFPLPAEQATPGMMYAVKTYGRDGWGREFRFTPLSKRRYHIASAGADGIEGSKDDITLVTPEEFRGNWEFFVKGIFVRRVKDTRVCLIHRVAHELFVLTNGEEARQLTGSSCFDAVHLDQRNPRLEHPKDEPSLIRQIENHPGLGKENPSDPLLLVQVIKYRFEE